LELILADLATVEKKRRERVTKQVKVGDKAAREELELLDKLQLVSTTANPRDFRRIDRLMKSGGLIISSC